MIISSSFTVRILLLAQGELVIAMELSRNRDTQEAIKHKMRRLGLMPEQIEEIVRTRKVPDLITLIFSD